MLPRQHRLSEKDFPVVKKEGRKIFGPLFGLLIKEDQGEEREEPEFGFIVSKKIDKRAVIRNKVKRRIDQALLFFLPKIKSGVKVIFLAKKSLVGRGFTEIKAEMARMLKKGDLLPN